MPTDTCDRAITAIARRDPGAAARLECDLAMIDSLHSENVQTFTVTAKGESITFESGLTDGQVRIELLSMRSKFAKDLIRYWNNLSPKQYAWAHKLAVDSATRRLR
jgi:hypothetical protein